MSEHPDSRRLIVVEATADRTITRRDKLCFVRIGFRPLERRDFSLVARWLAEPLVVRWWNHDSSPAAVERDFGPCVDRRDATEVFIAAAADPFGLIQRYPIEAEQDYFRALQSVWPVPAGALGIDYLIGVPAMRGRGLGRQMITTFADLTWTAHPQARDIVVPVSTGNLASWRALEGAGFRRVAAGDLPPDNPRDPPEHYVYRLRRPLEVS
ncbi:MAG: GNAT family N-acetyltransferase [Solirubrobacterales bacterium]|nr:GNAT family N-acetyltransferase [Solirubrobacterales bacterium]MBV9714579.1 GNAT family N-acetyltransferase [Solirubrobacterales bacterium]